MHDMRVDRLVWFLRFAPSRSVAQSWVEAGHFRLNGRRIERAATSIKSGDVLVIPLRQQVLVIELISIPTRRGPANEATACYRTLDAGGDFPIARKNTAATQSDAAQGDLHS